MDEKRKKEAIQTKNYETHVAATYFAIDKPKVVFGFVISIAK